MAHPSDSKDQRFFPPDFFDAEGHGVPMAVCPHCAYSGNVRVSPFTLRGERHLHWYCSCCHHVWLERDPRAKERQPYQPPMAK
jgi:hypothetical protein